MAQYHCDSIVYCNLLESIYIYVILLKYEYIYRAPHFGKLPKMQHKMVLCREWSLSYEQTCIKTVLHNMVDQKRESLFKRDVSINGQLDRYCDHHVSVTTKLTLSMLEVTLITKSYKTTLFELGNM